jgi:hypothetical protein
VDNSKGNFGIQVDFNTGEEEIMIFPAKEYDVGASLHPTNTSNTHLMEKGRGAALSFFKILKSNPIWGFAL